MPDINTLLSAVEDLNRRLAQRDAALEAKDVQLREREQQIEHLKFQLAKLRRARFGQVSEQLEGAGQLPLSLEAQLQALIDQALPLVSTATAAEKTSVRPVRRKHLPEHFERHDNVIPPKESMCPCCGGALGDLGQPDEAEVLEAKTVTFTVTRHIRPKKRCSACSTIVQAPAPARPIERSFAGASLLALVLSWKYGFHLPLHRQCQIFAHAGLTISRTTLMQWVGASAELFGPLAAAVGRYVLSASNVNADDTPIKVLAPGSGKTKKGRLWTYVRNGKSWGSTDPPAVWYQYSPSWHGSYPQTHLAGFKGSLQVDEYAGFDPIFLPSKPGEAPDVLRVACMAHARRKYFDVYEAYKSPVAEEALGRIRQLYQIEEAIRGRSPEARVSVRQAQALPLLKSFHAWLLDTLPQVEQKSPVAAALNYSLNHWEAMLRYAHDGRLEIDNNAAERSIRGIGVGRRNYLFFGSDSGGERAAIIYTLVETCRLNNIDPQRYLQYLLEHIADHPVNRIEELLPWNVADQLAQPDQITQALAA